MAISKLLVKIRDLLKEKVKTKLKKKARKKARKTARKLVCVAFVGIGLVMLYQHRRPIMAAIVRKALPEKKCPVFKKRT